MRGKNSLNQDVAQLLHKEVLSDAEHSSLSRTPAKRPKLLPPRAMGLRIGIDPQNLAALANRLEAESYVRATTRQATPASSQSSPRA